MTPPRLPEIATTAFATVAAHFAVLVPFHLEGLGAVVRWPPEPGPPQTRWRSAMSSSNGSK